MTGLALDKGLFVPDTIPTVEKDELESWRSLSYPDLAVKVISQFVKDDQVPSDKLEDIIKRSCAAFRVEDVTPVVSVGGHKILVSRIVDSSRYANMQNCPRFLTRMNAMLRSSSSQLLNETPTRNSFMDRRLLLKTWLCKCWETSLNTFWKQDLMVVVWLSWAPPQEILDQPLFMAFVERRVLTASFFFPADESHQFKNDK